MALGPPGVGAVGWTSEGKRAGAEGLVSHSTEGTPGAGFGVALFKFLLVTGTSATYMGLLI